jgi:hypothetical protein
MTEQEALDRIKKLKEAAMPLIKLLNEDYHPHHTIVQIQAYNY